MLPSIYMEEGREEILFVMSEWNFGAEHWYILGEKKGIVIFLIFLDLLIWQPKIFQGVGEKE